jgi:regulator of cell morphogenesis and NO signaling
VAVNHEESSKQAGEEGSLTDWRQESLSSLIRFIIDHHHGFTRAEIERLEDLLSNVCSVYGLAHQEIVEVRRLFRKLERDLLPHMTKEEEILFPYVLEMEDAEKSARAVRSPLFGSVSNPVRIMMMEHELAGEILTAIRDITGGFSTPCDTRPDFDALYRSLAEFEGDLRRHIDLENNILFPRAVEMEARLLNRSGNRS